jgi:hypothetical protein
LAVQQQPNQPFPLNPTTSGAKRAPEQPAHCFAPPHECRGLATHARSSSARARKPSPPERSVVVAAAAAAALLLTAA